MKSAAWSAWIFNFVYTYGLIVNDSLFHSLLSKCNYLLHLRNDFLFV